MCSSLDDDDLLLRAVQGDLSALKVLLADVHDEVRTAVARRIPADVARLIGPEDVLQETLVQVFQRIHTFKPQGSDSFRRWVSAVALNRLRNAIIFHRAAKRGGGWTLATRQSRSLADSAISLLDSLAGPGQTPSRTLRREEAALAVQAAIKGLPEPYHRAIWLVYMEDRPVREAAASMERTERAVHGLCRRGLKLLKERLAAAPELAGSFV